jgi:hypothetical protein
MGCQNRRRFLCVVGCLPFGRGERGYALAEQSTGMVRGRLLQDAFYLLFFAVAGILMAVPTGNPIRLASRRRIG